MTALAAPQPRPGRFARLWARSPVVVDTLLAVVFAGLELGSLAFYALLESWDPATPGDFDRLSPLAVAAALLVCLPLPLHRHLVERRQRAPLPVLLLTSAISAAATLAGIPMAWWAPLAALYEVAVQRERRVSAWAAVGACVLAYLAQLVGLPQETWVLVTSAFWYPALFAVPWWLGDRARRRRERERLLDRRERERALRTVADERARLARDLHDLLAQSIGVMVATASAGRGSRDGDAARVEEALARIEETGRASMAEVRRLLAMLRGDVPAPVPDPQPGLDDLDDLLGQVRRQGLAVTVAREGEPRPLDPSVDLSAHRIVQEAFANVLRHAGQTRVDLRIAYDRECVRIEVRDHGGGHPWAADAGEGTGLLGLRERALLVGGSLSAEALPGGGFRVVADLPLAAAR